MPLPRTWREFGPKIEEEGTYEIECVTIREDRIPSIYSKDDDGKTAVIKFGLRFLDMVDDDGVSPVELEAMANDQLGPRSKLGKWLNAFGLGVGEGWSGDIMLAKGKRAMAVVAIQDRGEKGLWNKIEDIIPMPRKAIPRQQRQIVREAEPEVEPELVDDPEQPPYHPVAAKTGEPVVNADPTRLVSPKELQVLSNALQDAGLGYSEVAESEKLPALPSQIRLGDYERVLDTLREAGAARSL
jgi:hypothetical protein